MSREAEDIDIQLELRDRINYPHILQYTILNIKRALSDTEIDMEKVEDMMWDYFTDIPHSWYDEKFTTDVKKAFIQKTVDARPIWGDVRLSKETCEEYGMATSKVVTGLNIYLLKNAIVNLLHRRDMLVRKKKIEYSTGVNLALKTLDDLGTYEDIEETTEESIEELPVVSADDEKILDELKQIEKEEEKKEKPIPANRREKEDMES